MEPSSAVTDQLSVPGTTLPNSSVATASIFAISWTASVKLEGDPQGHSSSVIHSDEIDQGDCVSTARACDRKLHIVGSNDGVAMARGLCVAGRAVAEVPLPGCNRSFRQVFELDVERCASSQGISREGPNRQWNRCRRGRWCRRRCRCCRGRRRGGGGSRWPRRGRRCSSGRADCKRRLGRSRG